MKYMHREEELVTWYSSSAGSAELHRIAPIWALSGAMGEEESA